MESKQSTNSCSSTTLNVTMGIGGTILLGVILLMAISKYKSYERVVTVKGLCEREVLADRAIYPIQHQEMGNNLAEIYSRIEEKNKIICGFLYKYGITLDEISINAVNINDRYSWGSDHLPQYRYVVTSVINVYTTKVDKILKIQSDQSKLLESGIAITSGDSWENPIVFEFESLNDIKPEMIEEANKNAFEAAEQFAKDSDSKLGKVKEASQGMFSISPRDMNTPHIKKIRVVNNVSYYLE